MFTRSFPLARTASVLFAVVSFLWASETLAGTAPKEKARGENTRYAIVAEKKTVEEGPWKAVVEALRKKHSARVFQWGGGWLQWLDQGVSFSEGKKGQKWVKQPAAPPQETRGPDDTTRQFVEELNTGQVDMVSSSGHATEHDWQMGYSYRSGQIATPRRISHCPPTTPHRY